MNHDAADELTISFPARSGYLEICRLNATSMAASAGFDVAELDDVRLAVDEAVAWLLGDDVTGTIELVIERAPGRFRFRGLLSGADIPSREIHDLLHAILGATTDHYEAGLDGNGHRFLELTKQAADG